MDKNLAQSIIKTLAYFDIFDQPLTKEELFRFLWKPPAIDYLGFLEELETIELIDGDVKRDVKEMERKKSLVEQVEQLDGFYFLKGRQEIVETRRQKTVYNDYKIDKAIRAVKKISFVPFLQGIFVCNSVGSENAWPDSDIDFFIITAPKRIWLVRFFTNFILRLISWRSYGQKVKDKICLSFFIDSNHLNLYPCRSADEDGHFAYWLNQMIPIYNQGGLYKNFLKQNSWTKSLLPHIDLGILDGGAIVVNGRLGLIWKKVWEKMWQGWYGDLFEDQAKKFQLAKMKLSLINKAKDDDNDVVISDTVLKFHENDRRREYNVKWEERMNNHGNPELIPLELK